MGFLVAGLVLYLVLLYRILTYPRRHVTVSATHRLQVLIADWPLLLSSRPADAVPRTDRTNVPRSGFSPDTSCARMCRVLYRHAQWWCHNEFYLHHNKSSCVAGLSDNVN